MSDSSKASTTPPTGDKKLKRPKISDAAQPDRGEDPRSSIKVSSKDVEADAAARAEKQGASKSSKSVATEHKPNEDATSAHPDENKPTEESDETGKKNHAFKRHDHVAYVALIKSKADELIKKKSDCTLARLCRHSVTDEWTLQLYTRKTKTFSFIIYSWDEIDEKWEQSYESEDRPVTQWEHHLRFSSASKECSDLKQKQR